MNRKNGADLAGLSRAVPDLVVELKRFIDARIIEAAIPRSLKGPGLSLKGYERIGGLTNRNYKVYLGEDVLVLRLPGRGTGRFINRSTERANHDSAARAGFTPRPVYFDGRTGVKLSTFLSDAEALGPNKARRPDTAREIALFLARFHKSSLAFVNDFDVFRMARIYERVARSRLARFYQGFGEIKRRFFSLERPLASMAPPKVACHNDLVPENILRLANGELTLIDWEYSGMNDPAWDLASFLLESSFDPEASEGFLEAYFGRPASERDRLRVESYMALQDYLWSLWSLLQETSDRSPQKSRSYREYGLFRFERGISRLQELEARYGIGRGNGAAADRRLG